MPDHLGADQRKTKEDNEEEKPIQGAYLSISPRPRIRDIVCASLCILNHALSF